MKTVIRLSTTVGGTLSTVVLKDEDATIEAIAEAVRSLTYNGMSAGDVITVTEEE